MSEAVAPAPTGSVSRLTRVLSDERLARRASSGDERAFAAIFDRYHQSLYRYCLAIVGDSHDAQDALQNTMVKVLRALPGEERRIELKPWLYRIAHNESIELIRRRRETRPLDTELPAPGPGPVGEAASRERLGRLLSDLDELPERQRGALVMRELAGLDFAAIGVALGTSAAVARQTLYEARLSLRQMDEGREMSCATVTRALSDGDGRVTRRRDLRAHLRTCADCRRFAEEIKGRERDLAALAPLPALAAAGLLQGLLGGQSAAAGGVASALGGGAAKTIGASALAKGAATVAVVATIGVGAADRGGLVDVGLPGGGSPPTEVDRPVTVEPPAGGERVSGTPAAGSGSESGPAASGGELGGSRPVEGGGKTADLAGGEANAAPVPAPTARGNATSHPHGKGHEKQLPDASAHGQQTAAAHKATGKGSAGPKGQPAKPSHPAKPPQPAKPPSSSAGKGAQPPPHSAAAGAQTKESGAPKASPTETSPPGPETGKKP